MKNISQDQYDENTPHDLYRALRRELEARKIHEGAILYDSIEDEDEEEEYAFLSYQYEAESGLDIEVLVNDLVHIAIGPVIWEGPVYAIGATVESTAKRLADIIQMVLNGQLTVNVTVFEKNSHWEAAELVWVNKSKQKKTIGAVPNYSYSKAKLKAILLQNTYPYSSVTLGSHHPFYPQKVNGRIIEGRVIDFDDPTPLTYAQYKEYGTNLTVQLMGGEPGEAIWQVFYKCIEFWLITVVVGTPLLWFAFQIPEAPWWHVFALQGLGFVGVILISVLTTFALGYRRRLLEAGKRPPFERIEQLIDHRLISVVWALALVGTLYIAPLWTTKENPGILTTAFQNPSLILPLTISSVAIFVAMAVMVPTSRLKKVARMLLMMVGYGGVLYCNFVVLYGGEGAAQIPMLLELIVDILPVIVMGWYIADCFRKPKRYRY